MISLYHIIQCPFCSTISVIESTKSWKKLKRVKCKLCQHSTKIKPFHPKYYKVNLESPIIASYLCRAIKAERSCKKYK